jgi:uncharacterized protein YbjT (DUF2867 family)
MNSHPNDPTASATRLVFGASGYIGTNLVPRLLAEGGPVRAAARNRRVIEAREWPNTEVCQADALDRETLGPVLAGIDTAYYLVHSMSAGRNFGRLDHQAAVNFRDAAAEAGVRRIVYLGGLVPREAASEHLVSRQRTGDVLREGPVPVTEIRAGIIVGPGSAAFEVMRDLVVHLPVMITPKWVHRRSTPIALDNLLEYLVRIPDLVAAEDALFDAGGPEDLTYEDMMRILAESLGRRPPIILPVPLLTPKLSSYWLRFVTSVPTNIAQALIQGLKHDFTTDDTRLKELVPQRLLSFREAVEAVFVAERTHMVQARWTEGAFAMRQQRFDYAFYAKRASGSHTTHAAPASVWTVLAAIGGENRYYYLNILWTIRETMDWLIGGPGLKRGRRDPKDLRVGDKVDSWTVIGVEPEQRLTLAFGMKAPGAGVLEFEMQPRSGGGTELTATAYWHPAGVWGLMYWYPLVPFHGLIFEGMTRAICERAEALERDSTGVQTTSAGGSHR